MIPKKIFQTWENNTPPFKMSQAMESWKQKNPTWEYKLFTSEERVEFIKNNFSKDVLDAYYTLIPPAFKADLWRYCVLFIEGGVYVDADMICDTPLDEWISGEMVVVRDDPMAKKWLANGFIGSTKKQKALKEIIDRIVLKCNKKQLEFYLDYTGPALWGKVVNKANFRLEEEDYPLGDLNSIKILKHDYSKRKFTLNNLPVVHTEYNEYRDEMSKIGNEPFYNYVQREEIFSEIPRQIIWTTYDNLDINNYMISSYEKNSDWDVKYFSNEDVDTWFENSIYREAYSKLSERGERTDFFRYCYLYEHGGVYADADTYCNQPLDKWIGGCDLIVGLEALVSKENSLGFDNFAQLCNDNWVSVCNWFFAVKPKHPIMSKLINDIINNPSDGGVLKNTGPGRFTKWMIEHFGRNNDFSKDVVKGKSKLLSINRFGSNQSHSNSIKQADPFSAKNKDIYITHMFDGTWRGNVQREKIKIIPSNKSLGISHNLTLQKIDNGFKGVARWDKDTERTHFMKKLGDCRSLNELIFDNNLNLISQEEKQIKNYTEVAKFEDFRHFSFNGKDYYSVSFIDENWNTRVAILDSNYRFIKKITLDYTHRMRFGVGHEVEWEKNYLFFEKDKELYLIYSTTPRYIVYKCINEDLMDFEKFIDIDNHHSNKLPSDQFYFSSNTSTGGSTSPIWIEEKQMWVYLIHTKIYDKKRYNHFSVWLDKDLKIVKIKEKPFLSQHINYDYFFVSSMINDGDYVVISGGISDNSNFTWKIPKNLLLK